MKTKIHIEPCPFCNHAPQTRPEYPKDEGDSWAEIACRNLRCQVDAIITIYDERGTEYCLRKAAKFWNRSATNRSQP